jgi:hypothetical protein
VVAGLLFAIHTKVSKVPKKYPYFCNRQAVGLKEWGFFSTYYTYITVFIRNAANLTLLLLKGSKLRKRNKN